MQVQLGDKLVTVHVQYGNAKKKIALHIEPPGLIMLKAPKLTSEEVLRQTVEKHGTWILETLARMEQAKEALQPKDYQEEGTFYHLGRAFRLQELIKTEGRDAAALKKELKRFYIASCKQIVAERIKLYQTPLKARPKSVDIVESKATWGTCSWDKKLTFNYRLAMAPLDVIDYVVIHELCHLHHMNHDRSFWRLVGSIMPDFKEKQAYLARQSQAMTL